MIGEVVKKFRPAYYLQLDSLRAFAVVFVIISHWLPSNHFLNRYFPGAVLGVVLFFVLSGFLISEILLKQKEKTENHSISKLSVFKNFYLRRALRIFPIYYLCIFFLFLLPQTPSSFKENFFYHFTYTSNIYFYKIKDWDFAAHLWTLSVEEQFYIIWPLILIFTPGRYLIHVILSFVVFGIVSKFIFSIEGTPLTAILTPTCFDSFGAGALLALAKNKFTQDNFTSLKKASGVLCVVSMISFAVFKFYDTLLPIVLLRLMATFVSFFLILIAVKGIDGWIGVVMNSSVLLYLGKISYGLYLYHNFIPWFNLVVVFPHLPILKVITTNQSLFIGYNAVCLLVVSSLSWFVIEFPMNNLKRYFNYK